MPCSCCYTLNSKTPRTGAHIFNANEATPSWRAGLWILARPLQKDLPESSSIEEACQRFGIARSTAYEAAKAISNRLATEAVPDASREQALREKDFTIAMLRYQLGHPGSRIDGERVQLSSGYRAYLEDRRAHYGVTLELASQVLGISIDTLKKTLAP